MTGPGPLVPVVRPKQSYRKRQFEIAGPLRWKKIEWLFIAKKRMIESTQMKDKLKTGSLGSMAKEKAEK